MHEIGRLTHGVFSVLINGMPIANTVIHLIDRVSCLYVCCVFSMHNMHTDCDK